MFEELVKRLNEYSAKHEKHGGITAEAADAIEALSKELMDLKMLTCYCCEPPKEKDK